MRHREIIRSAPERTMFGLTKLRIVEIGVALLLTLAALLFVGLTVWAAEIGADRGGRCLGQAEHRARAQPAPPI